VMMTVRTVGMSLKVCSLPSSVMVYTAMQGAVCLLQ
jgi:hypothetical protein